MTIISKHARIDQLIIKAKLNTASSAHNMIDKAAELVKANKATPRKAENVYKGDGIWTRTIYSVDSQSGGQPHFISAIANDDPENVVCWHCDCNYFQKANGSRPHINGQPLCTHVIAAALDDKATADMEATNAAAWRGMQTKSAKAGSGRAHMEAENAHMNYWNSQTGKDHATLINAANNGSKFEEMSGRPNRLPQFPEGM